MFCIANRIASHRFAWNRITLFVHPSIFCTQQRYNPSFQNHLLLVVATAALAAAASPSNQHIAIEHAFGSFLYNTKLYAILFYSLRLKQGRPVSVV